MAYGCDGINFEVLLSTIKQGYIEGNVSYQVYNDVVNQVEDSRLPERIKEEIR